MTDLVTLPADEPRRLALLKAIGFDRLAPEQRELALAIADRYALDPMLRHIVLIDGRVFLTRDALLHIAHRSGQFDGIAVTEPTVVDGFWRCSATVFRKDMTHPFTYPGRYPASGGNQKFAPEMAIKVAESMALRRAFNVAAPVVEERWDTETPAEPAPPRPTAREIAAQKAAEAVAPEVTVLMAPMTPEASARYSNVEEVAEGALAVEHEPRTGLDAIEFAAAAREAHVLMGAVAKVIGCKADEVTARVAAMTDTERGVLADELNLDWRSA